MDTPTDDLAPGITVAPGGLQTTFTRAGGPGGQNVNKLNTRAVLRLDLALVHGLTDRAKKRLEHLAGSALTINGEILITSSTHRTQERNRKEAMEKLRKLILTAMIEPKHRRPTKPTKGSRQRRLESKHRRGEIKKSRGGSNPE